MTLKVAQVLISNSWGSISPEALERGIGGREGSLLYLSKAWAAEGLEITNFVNIEKTSRIYENKLENGMYKHEKGFHEYVPLSMAKPMLQNFPYDVVISWEIPSIFDDPDINKNAGLKLCEMQVCHLPDKEMISAGKNLDYMCALSNWHKNFLLHSGLEMKPEKVLVFPNGIDIKRYKKSEISSKMTKKVPKNAKFVYSSSPDRGLWYLLQIWPFIRQEFPKASLSVCYGVDKWVQQLKWTHSRVGEMALGIETLMDQPGITNLGKIGQDQLSKLQIEADAWLYPFDPMSPTESSCISAQENLAAGNPLIHTGADCMEEEYGRMSKIIPLPFQPEYFAEETITTLKDIDLLEYYRTVGRQFAEKRDWSLIAKSWISFFEEEVK